MALTFSAALLTQWFFIRALKLQDVGFLSALVTSFGLSLLVRADNYWVHPLVASVAMASKFLLRIRGKHLFNPANLGVIFAITVCPGAWCSPGQWGQDIAIAAWILALGAIVSNRARRDDISLAFIFFFLVGVAGRVTYLGQRWEVWLHLLRNGSLLLFTFFMISDPMTIPNDRRGRILYAATVAAITLFWQYGLFRPNALIWALFLATPLVPLMDRVWRAPKFSWAQPST